MAAALLVQILVELIAEVMGLVNQKDADAAAIAQDLVMVDVLIHALNAQMVAKAAVKVLLIQLRVKMMNIIVEKAFLNMQQVVILVHGVMRENLQCFMRKNSFLTKKIPPICSRQLVL